GLKQTVLIKSTKDSQLVEGMLASFGGENILKDFKPSGTEYALGIRLTGKFKTAFPDGPPGASSTNGNSLKESTLDTTVVLIGDADLINDDYSIRRMNTPFGPMAQAMNGNLNFAQNILEQVSGDNNLIAVRSRALLNRPFTRVKAMQAEAESKYMSEIRNLQESRDQTAARLSELQQQKNQNQRFILSPEQQAEIENLHQKEAEIGKKLRQVEKDLRRDVVGMQRKIQWYNILTIPMAVGFVGIVLAIYKHKRTSAK
ncbi:MAG: hypothetical protein H7Y43_14180, partial [Akkermansiaceae bacterium]|nr:hypothetical protein [Verrucomicrobiales bacterium]